VLDIGGPDARFGGRAALQGGERDGAGAASRAAAAHVVMPVEIDCLRLDR
jgi:hypothetical protein